MATVYRKNGFRFFIWPNDHSPPHVHVENAEGQVAIEIESLKHRVKIEMKPRDVSAAIAIVADQKDLLLKEWRKIHG